MGILVEFCSMGANKKSCKGYYFRRFQIKQIKINSDLTKEEQLIILAHELGHAALNHKPVVAFVDFIVLDVVNKMEICANYFSADIIMEDEDIIEMITSGKTFFEIACVMNVLPELLAYKYHSMEVRGYKGLQSPVDVSGRYLNEYQRPVKVAEDFVDDSLDD